MPKRSQESHRTPTKRRRLISLQSDDEEEATGSQSQGHLNSQPRTNEDILPVRRRRSSRRSHVQSQAKDEEEEEEEDVIMPVAQNQTNEAAAAEEEEEEDEEEEEEEEDDDDDDDDKDVIVPARRRIPSTAQSAGQRQARQNAQVAQAERERDEDDDGGGDSTDEDDSLALNANGEFASSGILQSVRLDRFMSHECFSYDLGPNVNIVNGANGSGKSAIVAALQLGLGGKAGFTERGSRLDDHIKHNEQSAVITIKILNRKVLGAVDMSYKHDVYGDVITIERRLFRGKGGKAGSSTWLVRGKKPRQVKGPETATPRREVMDIVDHFGFMVHNPVAILTQTKSKAFLAKSKPSQHYKLYREATLLQPLEAELISTVQVCGEIKKLISSTLRNQPDAIKKLEKLEHAYREAKEMNTIHERILAATIKLAWTIYQESELKLRRNEKRTAAEFQPNVDNAHAKYVEENKRLESRKACQDEFTQLVEEATQKTTYAKDAFRKARTEQAKTAYDIERLERSLKANDEEINDLKKSREHVEVRMERARSEHFKGQRQKSQLVTDFESLTRDEKDLQEQIAKAREEDGSFVDERLSVQDECRGLQEEDERLERSRESKMREFVQLQNVVRNKDQLGRFGHYVPDLVSRIRSRRNKFSHPPVGPVGHYVKLEDQSWAATIEQAIGRTLLTSFIVGSSADQRVLQGLLPRQGPRPNILVMNMQRSRYEVAPSAMPDVQQYGHATVLESVTINHDIVFNALVDLAQIEQTVLNERDEDITQLAWSHTPHVGNVWNKKGERAYSRNGSKTFRKAPRHFGAMFLTKDMSSLLNSMQEEAEALGNDVGANKARLVACQRRLREMQEKSNSLKLHIRDATKQVDVIQRKKAVIEDKLSQAGNAFDPSPFECEADELNNRIKELEQKESALREQVDEAKSKVENEKEKIKNCQTDFKAANAEQVRLDKELHTVSEDIAVIRSKVRAVKLEYDKAKNLLDEAHSALDQARQALEVKLATASGAGPRPDDLDCLKEPKDTVSRKVSMLKKRLETEQNRRGGKTAQQIEKEFLTAKTNHEKNRNKLIRIQGYQTSLMTGVKQRELNLKRLERTLRKMVRSNFRKFMGTRGHGGDIRVATDDNGAKELLITAQMASHTKGDGARYETVDLRSLSGGERSFTTLCFMMALAEICQNPVRVMDEIDVFQDEANRRASFKILIDFFKNYLPDRQVVIITPHSLPNIQANPSLRIVKLDAPRRSNTHDGRQQTQIDSFM